MNKEAIHTAFQSMQRTIHEYAKSKGFYDDGERPVPEVIALMHSELSEALEAYRDAPGDPITGNPVWLFYGENEKPEGVASELADVVIRVLDTAEYLGIDIGEVILKKHEYNLTRPHRHGRTRL